MLERVHAAGQEIIEACVAAGGSLSGEHGIGLEKRDAMPLVFSAADLEAQALAAGRLRPGGPLQPGEGPAPGRVPLRRHRRAARRGAGCERPLRPGRAFAAEVGAGRAGPGGRRADPVGASAGCARPGIREVTAPAGVVAHEPAEMVVRVRAGTTLAELRAAVRAGGQDVALEADDPARATVGGILAVGHSGYRRLGLGPGARHRAGGHAR